MTEAQTTLLKELSIADLTALRDELRSNLYNNEKFISLQIASPEDNLPMYSEEQTEALRIINYCSEAVLLVQAELYSRMEILFGKQPETKRLT